MRCCVTQGPGEIREWARSEISQSVIRVSLTSHQESVVKLTSHDIYELPRFN